MLHRRLSLALLTCIFLAGPAHAAHVIVGLACETTTDTTEPLDLDGALTGWRTFADAGVSNGDTFDCQITNAGKHGEGVCTYASGSPNTVDPSWDNSTDGDATALTLSGTTTICAGNASRTFTSGTAILDVASITVDGEAFGAGWNGDDTSPTKNDVYDGLVAGYQPLDSDLTSWAAITRASGLDTFVATPSMANLGSLITDDASGWTTFATTPTSANLRSLLTDESGTGVAYFQGGALGTPSSGTLTNATGLPISSGVSGLGSNVATFLATPTWTNFLTAVTSEPTLKSAGTESIWIPGSAFTLENEGGVEKTDHQLGFQRVTSLDYDTSTSGWAHFFIAMPKNWNEGTITFTPYWTATSGSGGVVFNMGCYALSNDDAFASSWGTFQSSTDTLIAASDLHVGPTSSAITIGNSPSQNDLVACEVTRDTTNGSDTLGVDALLIGVLVNYTSDAANDS